MPLVKSFPPWRADIAMLEVRDCRDLELLFFFALKAPASKRLTILSLVLPRLSKTLKVPASFLTPYPDVCASCFHQYSLTGSRVRYGCVRCAKPVTPEKLYTAVLLRDQDFQALEQALAKAISNIVRLKGAKR
jgi:hypothetical protein